MGLYGFFLSLLRSMNIGPCSSVRSSSWAAMMCRQTTDDTRDWRTDEQQAAHT